MTLEQRFFTFSPDLCCIIGMDGFIRKVNPAFEKILGFAEREVMAQPYVVFVHVDEVPATIEAFSNLKRGITTRYNSRYKCKDGSYKWIEWVVEPILEEEVMYAVGRDVGQHKQMLEQRERFFAVGADLLSIGNFDGALTWVSPSWEKTLGWTFEELTAFPWLHFVHPEDHERTISAGTQLLAGVELVSFENRYRCKDGSYRWISWRSRPFPTEKLIYGAAIDITERKRALFTAEEFRTLVEQVRDHAIFRTDTEGRPMTWNEGVRQVLGFEEHEFIGQDIIPIIFTPEDLEKDVPSQELEEAGTTGKASNDRWMRRKEGTRIWISGMTYGVYNTAGELEGFGKVMRDMTDAKQAEDAIKLSEERYRTFVNTISSVVWTTDHQGAMVVENPLWQAFTGQTWEEYKGWGWLNAIHPDDQVRATEIWTKSLRERSLYETKYRLQRHDGEYRYVAARGAAVIAADGSTREWVGTCTDIHDALLTADALRHSQERLELSLRNFPLIVYTCDTELRYTWVGKAHPNFNPQNLVGKRDDELLPPESIQELMTFKRRAIELGKAERTTLRIEVEGKLTIYDITAEPLYNDNVLIGLTVAAFDITERQLYEERFRLMANSIPQLAWMANPDGWIFWYNQRWYDYTGTTFEDMQGWGWQSVHDPEELPKILTHWRNSIDAGEMFDMEFPLKGADGIFRWFLTRAYPQKDAQGRVLLWFGTNTDISEQKQAREEREQLLKALEQEQIQLRVLLDNIPVAVVLAEAPSGKIVMANKRTEEIFRHPIIFSSDLNSYYEWESYDANGRRTESHEYPLAKVIATGEPYENEYHYQRGDGTRAWVRIMGAPIKDRNGNLIAAVVGITDIDAERQEQERRSQLLETERAARTEAERVGRMKDEFLATLSHELRTPLNAILGWSQILRKGKVDSNRMFQGLDTIQRNVRTQAQLIEDLLDMNRIISGKIRLNVQRVDMKSVIEAALETVSLSAEAKGVQLQVVFDPLVGVVSGDPARLQQIIWNLLSNAIKFTPRNGRVQIVLERVSSRVEVSVIDTGQGIKPEFLPHVFERFSQADGSITRKYGGLGLGLSIVRGLTELHGGTVRVTSAGENMGATFTVSLPIAAIELDTVKQNTDLNTATSDNDFDDSEQIVLTKIKILVVDDEPDARDLIQCVLEDAQATVITASSAQEALELVTLEAPDILISDIGMPDEDGYELIRKIRSLPEETARKIPAVALTAYARAEDRKRTMLAGYQMHITKPVESSELIAIVSSLITVIR
ncbi:multi-sensor hybrid histidine kinase [Calothrix sp. NIES-4071]|nr:multi-sensor hybrid histidine kinase [Calothrix sp. NIES-4071]BAZ54523.1 multi-sensor hybrid histidine kinase [Calothrix sp. NIES-4105]